MSEKEKTPDKKENRARIYTGEGYVPGRTQSRRRDEKASEKRPVRRMQEQKSSSGSWQEKLKERKRSRMKKAFCCLGGVLAAAYIAVAVYFGFHFYADTVVYGVDCSRKTVDEVKLEVADKLDEYTLEIRERENKAETITAGEIGLEYVDNGSIDRMMKAQRSYIWPVMILMERSKGDSVAFSYDKVKAETAVSVLSCMDSIKAVAPQDAYIGTTDTGFEVVSEVMGTTLDKTKAKEAILSALDAGAVSVSLEEGDCYINPAVYQDDEQLQADAAAMSELAKAKITYEFGSEQEVVDAALIREWIVRLSDGTFVIDDVCVSDYVESLAAKYDTFGLPLEFYTSIGTTVTLSGGDYGWCIDQSATVVELLNALQSGYRGTMEPVYLYTAMSHENQGIGYTYVEICISQQRMWCYENGNVIVDTPVVTGNPNKGNATPSGGVWAIDAKKRDAILTGEGYTSPVDYWMPFNGDVGIHDLQARAYFGGTIYLTNGSHGCVNTPYDQVQIIYDAVSIGTPVIVYD